MTYKFYWLTYISLSRKAIENFENEKGGGVYELI